MTVTTSAPDRLTPGNAGLTQIAPPHYPSALATERGFTVVRWVLGILLITTAVMKMSGGSGEILRVALPFVSPRLYSSGVVFEFILGLWLLIGIAPAWSWSVSLLFFGLLGYMSFQLGLYGQASCGCFGKIALNPWWAFGIDLAAVGALLFFRPSNLISGMQQGIPIIAGAGAILVVVFAGLIWHYGSLGSALAHIQGELIVVRPEIGDIGRGRAGEVAQLKLSLKNYSDRSIGIVGGTSNCSCVATEDLPITIPTNEQRSINVQVKFTGTPGLFRRTYQLYADTDKLKVMPFVVTGRTVE